MKSTLTLRRAIWNESARTSALNRGLDKAADKLDERLHSRIKISQAQGKVYRLGSLTARKSSRSIGNRRRGTSTRVVIGATFYRASAPGQPPAIRTGNLYRKLFVRRSGNFSIIARSDAFYSKFLDPSRPFFREPVKEYFRNEFRQDIKNEILGLL
jgi:hypothetical protein